MGEEDKLPSKERLYKLGEWSVEPRDIALILGSLSAWLGEVERLVL
jgi:hypothetical protein